MMKNPELMVVIIILFTNNNYGRNHFLCLLKRQALVVKVAVEVSSLCAIYHNPNYRHDNLLQVWSGGGRIFCENNLAKNFVVIKQFSIFGKEKKRQCHHLNYPFVSTTTARFEPFGTRKNPNGGFLCLMLWGLLMNRTIIQRIGIIGST